MNRDLWAILSDKASGEALDKIKSVPHLEGLWAYVKVHHWFCKTSEQGRINRRIALMNPATGKHEYEIASAIESWEDSYRLVVQEDPEAAISDGWKIAAVKCILTGNIKTHIDLKIDSIKPYDDLRNEIMAYAISKRIEKERGDDMDIDAADDYEEEGGEAESR